MAVVRSTYGETFGNQTTAAMSALGPHVAGDVLVAFVQHRITTGTYACTTPGWAIHPSFSVTTGNGMRLVIFYKVATSNNETPPTFTTSANTYWLVAVSAIADFLVSDIFGASATLNSAGATDTALTPSFSTAADNVLLIDIAGWYSSATTSRAMFDSVGNVPMFAQSGNNLTLVIGYRSKETAGAVPQISCYNPLATPVAANITTIAIKNAVGGSLPVVPKQHYTPILRALRLTHAANDGLTYVNSYTSLGGTLAGRAIEDIINASCTTASDGTYWPCVHAFNPAGTINSAWCGGGLQFATPLNLTNKILRLGYICDDVGRTGTLGAVVVFFTSTGNWAAFRVVPKSAYFEKDVFMYFWSSDATDVYDSQGTVDYTNITEIHFLHQRASSTYTAIKITALALCDKAAPLIITGGGPNFPIKAASLQAVVDGWNSRRTADFRGSGQLQYRTPIQLGNGADFTYVDTAGDSFEQPRRANFLLGIYGFNVGAGYAGVVCKTAATDTLKYRRSILAAENAGYFTIDPASSALASTDFENQQFRNTTVTWSSNIPCNNTLFASSPEVDLKAATVTNAVFGQPSGTHAAKIDSGATLTDCTFNAASSSQYALRIPTAGDYYLNNLVFNVHTKALDITAITGTVTIHIPVTDTKANYTYDTAGATVVFVQTATNTTYENTVWVAGTVVMLVNKTANTQLDYTTLVATGYTKVLVPGVDYTVGDEIEIRAGRKNGTTYYQEYTNSFVTTPAGGTISSIAQLQVCPICTAFGLDGDDYLTDYAVDLVDDEMEVTTTADFELAEAMVWWKTIILEEANMFQLWGAMSVMEDGSFRNNSALIPMLWDNQTAEDVVETTGRRFHRTDGARPIKDPTTGGGSLDIAWRVPVTVLAVGSGVTAQDKIDIANQTLDTVVEGTVTLRKAMRLANAVNAGKTSGQPTAPVFRDLADGKDRVVGTVDANGNRIAVAIDLD